MFFGNGKSGAVLVEIRLEIIHVKHIYQIGPNKNLDTRMLINN